MTESAFSADFEEKVVQSILGDPIFGEQVLEVMEPECFDLSWTKEIVNQLISYYGKYERFPSISLLKDLTEQEIKEPILRKECLSYIKKIQTKPLNGDSVYIKDKALSFFRKQHIQHALLTEVVPRIKSAELDDILPVIQVAINKGTSRDIGYEYGEDDERRFIEIEEDKVPTPWPLLTKMLGGGWEAKRLTTIIGGSGAGKSHMLVGVGVGALLAGKTVVHYTLELSDIDVARRYDACLTDVEINHVPKQKNKVLSILKNKLPKGQRLIVKEYPMQSASMQTIRAHLARLRLKDIIPDIIIIDYGDLLESIKKFKEERHGLSTIWMNMKTTAQELGIPIVTATQSNREGYNAEVLTPDKVSEDFKKIMHSDVIITLARNMEQKVSGIGKILMAKNRQGEDGQIVAYSIDTARSKIDMFELTDDVEEKIKDRLEEALKSRAKDDSEAMDSYLRRAKGN